MVKEDLADYLRNKTMLHFVSRCKGCDAKLPNLGSVPVKDRIVETEYQLPTGGRADIAVCVGNETKVVIEVFSTSRTALENRPEEPWYEVEAKAVLRMLKSNQSYGELECVRPDRVCGKCERKGNKRKAFGQWTMLDGPHKGKTFEEASSDTKYVNKLLGLLVKGQYQELNEQIVDSYRIAFELPKEPMKVSAVFRDGKLKKKTYLAFAEYLITDPDLYAIEAKTSYKLAEHVDPESMAPWDWEQVHRIETVTAKRVGPYKEGTKRASGVTLARFDSQLGKWTNI